MADQTFIACPHCGEPIVMSPMQLDIYRGRAVTCARCARQFTVEPKRTPLYELSDRGATLVGAPKPESAAGPSPTSAPAVARADIATGTVSAASAPSVTAADGSPPIKRQAHVGGWKLIASIVGGFVLIGAIATTVIVITLRRTDEETNRLRCAANLSQIYAALQAYARSNGGQFPDTIDRLIIAQTVTPTSLVCPSTTDTPAIGGTPQAWVLELQQPGHLSYVYIGQNMTIATTATQVPSPVVMYEPMGNHHDQGSTVLTADGVVTFLDAATAKAFVSRMSPVPAAPATQPAVK